MSNIWGQKQYPLYQKDILKATVCLYVGSCKTTDKFKLMLQLSDF